MPVPYLTKVAKETGKDIKSLEKYWNKAKQLAADDGKSADFAYITGIFQKMVGIMKEDEEMLSEAPSFLPPGYKKVGSKLSPEEKYEDLKTKLTAAGHEVVKENPVRKGAKNSGKITRRMVTKDPKGKYHSHQISNITPIDKVGEGVKSIYVTHRVNNLEASRLKPRSGVKPVDYGNEFNRTDELAEEQFDEAYTVKHVGYAAISPSSKEFHEIFQDPTGSLLDKHLAKAQAAVKAKEAEGKTGWSVKKIDQFGRVIKEEQIDELKKETYVSTTFAAFKKGNELHKQLDLETDPEKKQAIRDQISKHNTSVQRAHKLMNTPVKESVDLDLSKACLASAEYHNQKSAEYQTKLMQPNMDLQRRTSSHLTNLRDHHLKAAQLYKNAATHFANGNEERGHNAAELASKHDDKIAALHANNNLVVKESAWLPSGPPPKFAKAKDLTPEHHEAIMTMLKGIKGSSDHSIKPENVTRNYPTTNGHEDHDVYQVHYSKPTKDGSRQQKYMSYVSISRTSGKIKNGLPSQYGGYRNSLVKENNEHEFIGHTLATHDINSHIIGNTVFVHPEHVDIAKEHLKTAGLEDHYHVVQHTDGE